ncbi:GNAT family N-acetyltransferase [Inquilinus sp. YAF38]|uniref:GNAT family N-acetyltransferase n=1 Tax=Inquilinus sp. YAF38 TaxID=3233084 RepID=UPI003F93BE59
MSRTSTPHRAGLRGHGVAGRPLAAIEAHLRGTGLTRMRIGVLANNDSAIRAYRKHGFDPYEMVLEKRL